MPSIQKDENICRAIKNKIYRSKDKKLYDNNCSKTKERVSTTLRATIMIIYKPENKVFNNRKEAKQYFGTNNYYRLEKDKKDLIFINDKIIATNEINKRRNQNRNS